MPAGLWSSRTTTPPSRCTASACTTATAWSAATRPRWTSPCPASRQGRVNQIRAEIERSDSDYDREKLQPQTGSFATAIGTVVYEGDFGKTGDALKLNGVSVSDPENPVTNFFNSSVSTGGVANTARNPNVENLMGIDADQFDATGLLANNDTSAALRLTTVGDTFYPGAITFTTTLFAPDLEPSRPSRT